MPAQTLQTNGLVLTKHPPSDAFQMLSVFSAEDGLLSILQRIPKKSGPANATLLDLFDEATLQLETSNQGRTYFVKEAQLVERRDAIGRSYDALRWASALATLIARNPVHEESRAAVAALLRNAFAAFASVPRPDIVYFKSLYRFAREEGYPLKEHWFPTLPSADRATVAELLNRPTVEQTATPEVVARLRQRLAEYLRGHTEILVD